MRDQAWRHWVRASASAPDLRAQRRGRVSVSVHECARPSPYSLGSSATSQQYFSLRTNQPPATNQPAALFSQKKSAPATNNQPNEHAVWWGKAEHGGKVSDPGALGARLGCPTPVRSRAHRACACACVYVLRFLDIAERLRNSS
jgi:hypothetical protein